MLFKNEELWNTGLANNDDPYGKGIYRFAQKWAELMEERIAGDRTQVAVIAHQASHDADDEGITGFMYGAAVSVLSHVWEYGEELRRWHNCEYQIGDEGDRANENGGVINPAIMIIG